ncbi:MAG: hypothetical protein FJ009_03230 [Chloroflexi bacterium]|nr:hypothetical protein [Chloroflexota bacterium]
MFLKHGVALIESGDAGTWHPDRDDSEFEGVPVRRFATEVQIGDVMLLRTGISTIRAVGLVASDYLYLPQFDDVNGRDLQHARRVRWYALPSEYDFGNRVFGANAPSLSRINKPELVDYANRFLNSPPTYWQTATLPSLPSELPSIEPPDELSELVTQVQDLTRLYADRTAFGDYPTEQELVVHYVVPFLRALGWRVEQIAIGWRFIDVSVFRTLPRSAASCHFIIEAKRLGASVESALEQAKGYVRELGVPRDIVVTDGIRYRMYSAERDFAPIAYANLARLKQPALELFARMKRS